MVLILMGPLSFTRRILAYLTSLRGPTAEADKVNSAGIVHLSAPGSRA